MQYKFVRVKGYKKGKLFRLTCAALKRCFLSSLVTAVRMCKGCRPRWCGQPLMVWVDNERVDINWDASPVSSPVTALIPVANFNGLTKLNNIQHLFLMGVMNKTRSCLVLRVRFRRAAKLHAWAVKYKQAGVNNSRISTNWFSEC